MKKFTCPGITESARRVVLGGLLFAAAMHAFAQQNPTQSEPQETPVNAQAQPQPGWFSQLAAGMQPTWEVQLGVDAWQLRPSVKEDNSINQRGNSRLFLANSGTAWPYQDTSPWLTLQGSLRPLPDTLISLKYRANQAMGSQLDELSLDQAYYAFGARAGVLDYKTTWCRAYDTYQPWVRENDPICSVDSVGRYLRAAPGMQLYSNFVLANFKWQAVVGAYSPLWLNYDAKEFTNTPLNEDSTVTQNDKFGLSINAVQLENGLEMRLSFLRTDQSAEKNANRAVPTYRINQKVDVAYAGISFNPTPLLNVRLTRTQATEDNVFFYPPGYVRLEDTVPSVFRTQDNSNNASVLELNYQGSARDVFSLAYSVHDHSVYPLSYLYSMPSQTIYSAIVAGNYSARTVGTSLSWRRDWSRSIFTVLQWSKVNTDSYEMTFVGDPPRGVSSNGNALGLRLGYRL